MGGLRCKIVRRGRPPEDITVDTDFTHAMHVGDSLNVSGMGEFYVSGVRRSISPGRDDVLYFIEPLAWCPECGISYGYVHPDGSCEWGVIQAVMES